MTSITTQAYLKNYVERVQDVPGFLRRHLALIRDLDEKVEALQADIAKKQKAPPKNYDLESQVTRLVSLADEKVNIAAQCYDFIDKHIQNLDEDLRLLDNEVRVDKEKLGLAEDEPLEAGRSGRGGGGNRSRSSAAVAAAEGVPDKKRKGYRKRGYQGEEEGAALVPLPAENEPLYCYCQKPSHGEMVACDHEECALEWFHYECVGLTAAPVGEWLCPDCVKAKGGGS